MLTVVIIKDDNKYHYDNSTIPPY